MGLVWYWALECGFGVFVGVVDTPGCKLVVRTRDMITVAPRNHKVHCSLNMVRRLSQQHLCNDINCSRISSSLPLSSPNPDRLYNISQ